jgi:ubiquinone/menaquinone biosynthesis C-methylase UbiE
LNVLKARDDTHKSPVQGEVRKVEFMSIAPFVQTPLEVAKKMLDLSQIKPGEVLYDLGCGDGRLIILAGKDVGAKSTGIELREDLVERARTEIKRLNLEDKVKVIQGNFFDVNISDANVITLYLTSSANERLRPKLEAELKPGARVVSHDFKVPGWKPVGIYDELLGHTIYTYRIGEQL